MAEIINMPRLSDTMEEGTVAKWFKKVGDLISEGDILAEIETDKATMEFEAFYSGVLLYIGIKEGATAPVDNLLAIIGKKGEDISAHVAIKSDLSKPVEENLIVKKDITKIPENIYIINMPRLSDTMEEGTVSSWLKNVGDKVVEGDILAEIETDKAIMEFESFYSGTLLHIGIKKGESAIVDSLLAIIGDVGTDVSSIINSSLNDYISTNEPVAENNKVDIPITSKIKLSEKLVSQTSDTHRELITYNRIIASPLAKKIAKEKGINLSQIIGSGDGGRIIKRDIENSQPENSQFNSISSEVESVSEIANGQMRKIIAKRLASSKFTAPHYYLGVEFEMDNAISFRNQFNSIPDTKISFNDIVIKATSLALKKHPQVNSRWFDDKIIQHHHVHIGVAVAVQEGLVVPVVRFANELSLPQIGTKVKDYASRARDKKLTPNEMEESTFTISNLGMFGIQEFTSIINQPNSAILSIGNIIEKPVVKNGQIVIGNTMKLTLACDHRSVDGVIGSRFLETLKSYIENPVTLII